MTQPSNAFEGFQSRFLRSLCELHERELRSFLETFERFEQSGAAMPRSESDPDYDDPRRVMAHVLRAARGYLTWVTERAGRPITDMDTETDAMKIADRSHEFMEHVLDGWRRHLAGFQDSDFLMEDVHESNWGEKFNLEQMLEHAVVHPMSHRIQLERWMDDASLPGSGRGY